MSLGLFIVFVAVMGSLIAWGLKNEDRLIKLEDKILEDIRDSRAQAKREKNIHIVERRETAAGKNGEIFRNNREFVA